MSHRTHRGFLGRIVQRSMVPLAANSVGQPMSVVPQSAPAHVSSGQFNANKNVNSLLVDSEQNAGRVNRGDTTDVPADPLSVVTHTSEIETTGGSKQETLQSLSESEIINPLNTRFEQTPISSGDNLTNSDLETDIPGPSQKDIELSMVEEVEPNDFSSGVDTELHNDNAEATGQQRDSVDSAFPVQGHVNKLSDSADKSSPGRRKPVKTHLNETPQKSLNTVSSILSDSGSNISEGKKKSNSNDPVDAVQKNNDASLSNNTGAIEINNVKPLNATDLTASDNSTKRPNKLVQHENDIPVAPTTSATQNESQQLLDAAVEPTQVLQDKPALIKPDTRNKDDGDAENLLTTMHGHSLKDANVLPATTEPFSDSVNVNNNNAQLHGQQQKIQIQEASAPVVNISIAKIVVKAPVAQASAPTRRFVKSRRPGISLGDYLKE